MPSSLIKEKKYHKGKSDMKQEESQTTNDSQGIQLSENSSELFIEEFEGEGKVPLNSPSFLQGDLNSSLEALLKPTYRSGRVISPNKTSTHGSEADTELEKRIQSFQKTQSEKLTNYLETAHKRTRLKECALYFLNGWKMDLVKESRFLEIPPTLHGGFYIRWNGKGIVVNPGKDFLSLFHQQGLYIRDIDFVLVTRPDYESYADIQAIYDLLYQVNKLSPELHIIHYYLHQQAYQELSSILKPCYKQERHTIHSLERFDDSPEVEKVELFPGIILHYFPTQQKLDLGKNGSALGIRLDLKPSSPQVDKLTLHLGYLSGTSWSPLLAHHLGNCDILIIGFGNSCATDYQKLGYNEGSLGYFGTYSLAEEIHPRLLLCGEFGTKEGDIRLEIVKKLREELQRIGSSETSFSTVALPADNGLLVDLKSLQVECSVSKQWIAPSQIKIAKSIDRFGPLHYLSPSCCI